MTVARWDVRDPRLDRHATATGVGFVFFVVIGYLFAPDLPKADDSDEEVLRWFVDNDTRVLWQTFLFGLGGVFFLWFFATLASRLRRAESEPVGRLPAVIVAAAGAAAGLFSVGLASFGALAKMADEGVVLTPSWRVLFELGNMALSLVDLPAFVLVAAISLGVLRTGLLAEWLAWAGGAFLVLAIVDVAGRTIGDSAAFGLGGPFGILTFLVFLAWTLAASLLLWQATPAPPATEPTSAA
jgi:hypothetical protein